MDVAVTDCHANSESVIVKSDIFIYAKNMRSFPTFRHADTIETMHVQGGAKNGASLTHCKYSENSTTELRGNW